MYISDGWHKVHKEDQSQKWEKLARDCRSSHSCIVNGNTNNKIIRGIIIEEMEN
jgi:hypothetical protein